MIKHRCKYCNISTDLFFCPKCGRVFVFPQFIAGDRTLEGKLQSYINGVISEATSKKIDISSYSDVDILSSLVMDKFNEHIMDLENDKSKNKEAANSQPIISLLRDLADNFKAKDCCIAIAGITGSGKSTFINALLGKEVAYVHPTSETSVPTIFKYSEKGNYVKFVYYTSEEWNNLWDSVICASNNSIRNDQEDYLSVYNKVKADEVRDILLNKKEEKFYISSDEELQNLLTVNLHSNTSNHFFIKEVEIGLAEYTLPKNVILIDTLGFDDPVMYRKNICIQQLISASVVLLCVKATSSQFSSFELAEISNIFTRVKSKDNIYLIGTQFDVPKNFPTNWYGNIAPELVKLFSAKSYFESESNSIKRQVPVSAWYYNIIQRAKNDLAFWDNEANVDSIAEVLCRCLGKEIAYKYGNDNFSLKKCLDEHIIELESKTNMPNVTEYIISGPIKSSSKNAFEEFMNAYVGICKILHKKNTPYESKYTTKLRNQVLAINAKMSQNKGRCNGDVIQTILNTLHKS